MMVNRPEQSALASLTSIEPYRPFPLEVLPATVRQFIREGAESIGCDPSYIALPLLAGLSAAVGNTRRIRLKGGWTEPCNIWTAVIGESGTHKTPAQRLALNFLQDRQAIEIERYEVLMEDYEVELPEYEKYFKAWQRSKNSAPPTKPDKPAMRRVMCSDVTVEALAPLLMDNPRGLLLMRDELSGWLGSFNAYKPGSSDVSHWLEMFQGGPMTVDRKTGDRHTLYVPRAAMNITGGIQPEALRKALGRDHFENGLTARMLMAMPPRRPKRWTDSEVGPATKAAMDGVFSRLLELDFASDGEPIDLPLSVDALEVWVEFYNQHAAEQAMLVGDLAAAWSKLEAYAARFALLIQLIRVAEYGPTMAEAQTIDADSVQAGVELARWFGHETQRVYAVLNESSERRDMRKAVEFIQRRGGSVTARELMRGGPCCKSVDTAMAMLTRLETDGIGKWRRDTPGPKGGPPVMRFYLMAATDTDRTLVSGPSGSVVSVSVSQDEAQASGDEAA